MAALKPLETGVLDRPLDADALAAACAQPGLADAPGLFRTKLPLAPYAAALEHAVPAPNLAQLVKRTRELGSSASFLLVEGAGGLLVPLDASTCIADLVAALDLPLLLVAADRLGVLSSVLTCVESARARNLRLVAVALSNHGRVDSDPSPRTNRRILQERLDVPVLAFPYCDDDDDALADAAQRCGLLDILDAG